MVNFTQLFFETSRRFNEFFEVSCVVRNDALMSLLVIMAAITNVNNYCKDRETEREREKSSNKKINKSAETPFMVHTDNTKQLAHTSALLRIVFN